jgi:glycosyltransferase involved in cell wall biosynthesis
VDEGENGYLFEPGDVRGLADGVLRAIDSPELGSKARETIRKSFNFEDGAMKHLELYNDLIISYRK